MKSSVVKNFTGAAQNSDWCKVTGLGSFQIDVPTAFSGTLQLQRTRDGGSTAVTATDASGAALSFTAAGTYLITEPVDDPNVLWRVTCSAFTSGACNGAIQS